MPAARVYQGVVVANAFNFFVSAGQACLIPFLSLYFLYLDLSSFQAGLLLGIKALTGALSSAFWTQCVTTTSRRLKFVLVFSLMVLVMSHLVMVLMPSMKDKPNDFCHSPMKNFEQFDCSGNQSNCSETTTFVTSSEMPPFTSNVTTIPLTENLSTALISPLIDNTSTANGSHDPTDFPKQIVTSVESYGYVKKRRHEGHEEETFDSAEKESNGIDRSSSDQSELLPSTDDSKSSDALKNRLKNIQNQIFSAMLVLVVVSELFSSPFEQVADELYVSFLEYHNLPLSRRRTTKCWSLLGGSIMPWVVVIVIDHLPCYVPPLGSHRILFHFWLFSFVHLLSFLFSICYPTSFSFPPDVPRASQVGPPLGGDHYHHSRRWANLRRGLKLVVADGRAVLVTTTIFVLGLLQGVICTFLPWVIHNLVTDGSEFYIGAAIGLAAFGDLLAKFIGEWICRKLGHAVTIIFGMLIIATRLSLYGFLLKPWMALIGESAHLFGGALVAMAVGSHPAFRASTKGIDGENENGNPKKRKHIRGYGSLASFAAAESISIDSSLRLVRSGLGFSVGCCAAGLLSSYYGMSLVFWSASGTAVVWCLMFALLYPCCKSRCMARGGSSRKKNKTTGLASSLLAGRYKRLSKRDEEDDEDEEDDDDDDYDVDEDGSAEEDKTDWMDTGGTRKHT